MASIKGGTVKATPAGRVQRANRDKTLNVRMSKDELERFAACSVLDVALHGGDMSMAGTTRQLIRQWCDRIEKTAASQVATDGAKVLRKAV